jgi:hypothetical protein
MQENQKTKEQSEQELKDKDNLDELMKEITAIPPFTGDMAKDYIGILNKEMFAIRNIWKEYSNLPERNPLIDNHMISVANMYERLVRVGEAATDPKTLEEILTKMKQAEWATKKKSEE